MSVRLQHGEDDLVETHEINVTPFIDVMLVLLIIFMVAAPLATVDVGVDLPVSNATSAPRPNEPVFVSIRQDKSVYVGEEPVGPDGLGALLDKMTASDHEERIFLRADKQIDYDTLMQVMNQLRKAGYLKVALVGLEETGG